MFEAFVLIVVILISILWNKPDVTRSAVSRIMNYSIFAFFFAAASICVALSLAVENYWIDKETYPLTGNGERLKDVIDVLADFGGDIDIVCAVSILLLLPSILTNILTGLVGMMRPVLPESRIVRGVVGFLGKGLVTFSGMLFGLLVCQWCGIVDSRFTVPRPLLALQSLLSGFDGVALATWAKLNPSRPSRGLRWTIRAFTVRNLPRLAGSSPPDVRLWRHLRIPSTLLTHRPRPRR